MRIRWPRPPYTSHEKGFTVEHYVLTHDFEIVCKCYSFEVAKHIADLLARDSISGKSYYVGAVENENNERKLNGIATMAAITAACL